jgi:uncharacterized protein YfbU (UPF0304 family)
MVVEGRCERAESVHASRNSLFCFEGDGNMSFFDSEEAERLKRHQRLVEIHHEQEIAELNHKLECQKRETVEYVDAESSDMMDRIEVLERDLMELKKQLARLEAKT